MSVLDNIEQIVAAYPLLRPAPLPDSSRPSSRRGE